jgi:hypothetical protein
LPDIDIPSPWIAWVKLSVLLYALFADNVANASKTLTPSGLLRILHEKTAHAKKLELVRRLASYTVPKGDALSRRRVS